MAAALSFYRDSMEMAPKAGAKLAVIAREPGLAPARVPGLRVRAPVPPVPVRAPRALAQNRLVPARAPVLLAPVPVPPERAQLVPARPEPEPTRPEPGRWTPQAPQAAGCRCPCRSSQPNRLSRAR